MAIKAIKFFKDGDSWCATRDDFIDLHESPAGFGDTIVNACLDLLIKTGQFAPGPVSEIMDYLNQREEDVWISTKDNVPTIKYEKVIVWVKMFFAPSYMSLSTFNDGKWTILSEDTRAGKVTHWMPLPKKPALD